MVLPPTVTHGDLFEKLPSSSKFINKKKIAGCWRIAAHCQWPLASPSEKVFAKRRLSGVEKSTEVSEAEEQLIKVMITLKDLLKDGDSKDSLRKIIFSVKHAVNELLYKIEYVTVGPDNTYIITLSVAVLGEGSSPPMECSRSSKDFDEENPELCHKMIPLECIEEGIKKCLIAADRKMVKLPPLRIEYAPNHPSVHFSSTDAAYCQWESGNDDLSQRSLYKLVYSHPPQYVYLHSGTMKIATENIRFKTGSITLVCSGESEKQLEIIRSNFEMTLSPYTKLLSNALLKYTVMTKIDPDLALLPNDKDVEVGGLKTFRCTEVALSFLSFTSDDKNFSELLTLLKTHSKEVANTTANIEQIWFEDIEFSTDDIEFHYVTADLLAADVKRDAGVVHYLPWLRVPDQGGNHRGKKLYSLSDKNEVFDNNNQPKVVVAWNNVGIEQNKRTEALIVYNLFSRSIVKRINLHHQSGKYKISCISSMLVDNSPFLIIGIEHRYQRTITGYIAFLEICDVFDDDYHLHDMDTTSICSTWSSILKCMKKVHENQLSCIRVKGNVVYIGSYDRSFSIIDLSDKDVTAIRNGTWLPIDFVDLPMALNNKDCPEHLKHTKSLKNNLNDYNILKKTFAPTHVDIILSIAPIDGKHLFTTSWDTTIRYWEKVTAKDTNTEYWVSYQFPLEHAKKVTCITYYKMTICKDHHHNSKLTNEQSFIESNTSHNDHDDHDENCTRALPKVTSTFDDITCELVISGGLEGYAIMWDVRERKKPVVVRYLKGHRDEIIEVDVIDDHRLPMILTASKDKTLRVWDLLSGDCIRELNHIVGINSIDFVRIYYYKQGISNLHHSKESLVGDLILSATSDGVIVWNFLSNRRLSSQYTSPVISLATITKNDNKDDDDDDDAAIQGHRIIKHESTKSSFEKLAYSYEEDERKRNIVQINIIGTNESTIIASVDGKQICCLDLLKHSESDIHSKETKPAKKQVSRVNAIAKYSSIEKQDYLIAGLADGQVCIVKIDLTAKESDDVLIKTVMFRSSMQNVFCLTVFEPSKADTSVLEPSKADIDDDGRPALLFIGGIPDEEAYSLDVLDLDYLIKSLDSSITGAKYFQALKGHPPVRCSSILYNVDCREDHAYHRDLLVTGDYKSSAIVWLIGETKETALTKLFVLNGLHQQFVINVEIIDPLTKWKESNKGQSAFNYSLKLWNELDEYDGDERKKVNPFPLVDHIVVITGGYDGRIGLWPISFNDIQHQCSQLNSSNYKPNQSQRCAMLNHDDYQSVTAMSVLFPTHGNDVKPLLFTASIDNFIYVWDIYEQTRLRVLTGHTNRINALATYFHDSDGQNPILVSGSDDGSTVIWHDGLQHHSYPPPKHTIIRTFYSDIMTPGHWQQVKALKKLYPQLFLEMPHLFYLALIERQESFFVEFLDDLKKVITRIPSYPRSENKSICRWLYHNPFGDVDILEYAMHTNSLVALRAILLAWSLALNQDIEDSLNQMTLHAMRVFKEKNLLELATQFPVEYTEFFVSLRLVKCHNSVDTVKGKLIRIIPEAKRFVIIGSNLFKKGPLTEDFRVSGHRVWTFMTWVYDRLMEVRFRVIQGYQSHHQAVIPFMIPIKRFVDLRQFNCALLTASEINRLDIFESDVMLTAINHYWNAYGWKLYTLNFIQYTLTVFLFVVSIYAYQHVATSTNLYDLEITVRKAQAANAGFMFFMVLFGIDEVGQFIGKYYKLQRTLFSGFRAIHVLMNHFCFDLWNIMDCAVIVTGLMGSYSRFHELKECHIQGVCDRHSNSTAIASCLLAATAVMLWFKVLYYLRPIKAAGQFVVMVMLIISDIKYFLLVLLCVLIGFAQGFWLLLNDANPSSHFSDVKQSYYTTFMFMFGQIDSEELQNGKSSGFSKLYLVAFMLTMMLLLFNLLIALMGDSFSRTKEKIEAHYWKELASFMVDQSMSTPLLILLDFLGLMCYEKDEFVYVVKYASDLRKNRRSLGVNDDKDDDDASSSSDSDDEYKAESYTDARKRQSALEKAFLVSKRFIKAKATTDAHHTKLAKKADLDADIIHRSAKARADDNIPNIKPNSRKVSSPGDDVVRVSSKGSNHPVNHIEDKPLPLQLTSSASLSSEPENISKLIKRVSFDASVRDKDTDDCHDRCDSLYAVDPALADFKAQESISSRTPVITGEESRDHQDIINNFPTGDQILAISN